MLRGSAILKRVPYIPEMELAAKDKVGIVPLPLYFSQNKVVAGQPLKELVVHTEYGEGFLRRVTYLKGSNIPRRVGVMFDDGLRTLPASATFAVTKKLVSSDDIRRKIAEAVMSDDLGRDHQIEDTAVPSFSNDGKSKLSTDIVQKSEPEKDVLTDPSTKTKAERDTTEVVPNTDTVRNSGFNIYPMTINDQIVLAVDKNDPDTPHLALRKENFRPLTNYVSAMIRVTEINILEEWIENVSKVGKIHSEFLIRLKKQINQIKLFGSRVKLMSNTDASSWAEFLTEAHKKSDSAKPYLIIRGVLAEDGVNKVRIFLVLNNDGTQNIQQLMSPSMSAHLVWRRPRHPSLARGFATKNEALKELTRLKSKFTINNLDEVREAIRAMYVVPK